MESQLTNMGVVYKDPRQVKKFSLSQIEGSEIEVYSTILWGDIQNAMKDGATEDEIFKNGTKILAMVIKDWNLTDENNVKLPITEETLNKFTAEMIASIVAQTDFLASVQKKQ